MKSYFANSVQTAMEEARRELGEDAILVTSRMAPAAAGQPRRYEVVFATSVAEKPGTTRPKTPTQPPQSDQSAPHVPATVSTQQNGGANAYATRREPQKSTIEATATIETVLNEIKEIRQQLESLRNAARPAPNEPRWTADVATRQLFAQLSSADVDPDIAQQLLAAAAKRVSEKPAGNVADASGRFLEVLRAAAGKDVVPETRAEDLRAALASEIREQFRVDTGFHSDSSKAMIAALFGPPGAGKTATIAKLAIHYGLKLRRPALLVSTDNLRVAASEQLRAYASVLGLRFELAPSARALALILEEHCGDGLVLIDTPGFTPSELADQPEVLQFLAQRDDIRKHLVLPATMRCADASRVSAAYSAFHPSHLIFSRVDETTAFGPVLNEGMSSGRPVSFFTTGQRVPEDLEAASPEVLINRLLPAPEPERRMAAAA